MITAYNEHIELQSLTDSDPMVDKKQQSINMTLNRESENLMNTILTWDAFNTVFEVLSSNDNHPWKSPPLGASTWYSTSSNKKKHLQVRTNITTSIVYS